MPRPRRITPAGVAFHLCNRGNDRQLLFHEDADYQAFLDRIVEMRHRYPVEVPGLCAMPNHFHMTAIGLEDQAIPAAMHWLETRSSLHIREVTQTLGYGHVFQRRYWSRPIAGDEELLRVVRYIEANPLRAGLVKRAEEWRWSSLWLRERGEQNVLDELRVRLPPRWVELVNTLPPPHETADLAARSRRGRPARGLLRVTA
ncbi:MAG: transposase [Acidobacteriota bacterium]